MAKTDQIDYIDKKIPEKATAWKMKCEEICLLNRKDKASLSKDELQEHMHDNRCVCSR